MMEIDENHPAFEMEGLSPFDLSITVSDFNSAPRIYDFDIDEIFEEKKVEILELEKCENFSSLLLQFLLMPDKAEGTIGVLNAIDFEQPENRAAKEEFSQTNGCEQIIKAMHQLSESANMQWQCCKLIMGLTRNHSRNKMAFLQADAVDAIAGAMKAFPYDIELQTYGCGALRNLSSYDPVRVIEDGGLEALLSAMKEHSTSEDMQTAACLCLYNLTLCYQGKFVEQIINMGGGARAAEAHHLFKDKKMKVEEFSAKILKTLYCKELAMNEKKA